jgi:hypothetical protein
MNEVCLVMGVPLPIPGLEYQIECILLSVCDGTNTVDRVKRIGSIQVLGNNRTDIVASPEMSLNELTQTQPGSPYEG